MTRLPASGEPIIIMRGEAGYYTVKPVSKGERPMTPEQFNRANGITEAQVTAMRVGSMFGWDVPGADPATWEKNGETREANAVLDDRQSLDFTGGQS